MLLETYLKRLKLPTVRDQLKAYIREAEEKQLSYEDFLCALLEQEVHERNAKQIDLRIKKAKFPVTKTLDQYDFSKAPYLNKSKILGLAKGDYIQDRRNILFIGNSGTGKSHLSISLGIAACREGFHVQFYTASGLNNELIEAQTEKRLLQLEKQWMKADLVIVDEVGYIPYSQKGSELLFQFFSQRYERGSMIITSNREFSLWNQVFGDEQMTAALIDRLTHRAYIFPMNGDSYRFKQSLEEEY